MCTLNSTMRYKAHKSLIVYRMLDAIHKYGGISGCLFSRVEDNVGAGIGLHRVGLHV